MSINKDCNILVKYNPIDINNINNKLNDKFIWKKKENLFCNNCGKYGHIYKKCYEPLISYGIICLKISNQKIINFLKSKYQTTEFTQQFKYICIYKYIQKNINCNNKTFLDLYMSKISNEVEYLLVRRKFTYNYIYLIRGIYTLEIENIINSINLLTHKEYNNILTMTFEELWYDIWGSNIYKKEFINNFDKAKEQFDFFKEFILPQIKHKINIIYDVPEWGFPKGKRNDGETNLECAQREFEEETGIKSSDYNILTRLYPIVENVYGSNKINYRYIYYIAILNEDVNINNIKIHDNTIQSFEIGDIGFNNDNNIEELFRNYNKERIDIIENLKLFMVYNTRYLEKFYHDKNNNSDE
jgi:8-oxo-dGTP pyrophosphatase MutT (NUDIX family)